LIALLGASDRPTRELLKSDVKIAELPAARVASARGDGTASMKLAIAYGYGIGVHVDTNAYLSFLTKAATQGLPQAWDLVGQLQIGTHPSDAVRNFKRAADAGYVPAKFDLATSTLIGRGIPKDERAACALFHSAALQEYPDAEYSWGTCLGNGVGGVQQDSIEALVWWTRAADHGFPLAHQTLGIVLTQGLGVPRNPIEGMKWLLIATRDPDNEVDLHVVKTALADASRTRPATDLKDAQRRATSWIAQHPRRERSPMIDFGGKLHL